MEDYYCEEVLSGKTPVQKISETNTVLAFHHTKPFWPVHIVVIPRQHIPSLLEADTSIIAELFDTIKTIASSVKNTYGACRILTNVGEYQDSKHLHWHICFGERVDTK